MSRKRLIWGCSILLTCVLSGCGTSDNENNIATEQIISVNTEDIIELTENETENTNQNENEFILTKEEPYLTGLYQMHFLGLEQCEQIIGDKYEDKASEGNAYLILYLDVTNNTFETDYINPNYIEAKVDGVPIEHTYLLNEPHGYLTLFQKVESDRTNKGFVVWEVPSDWNHLEVRYNNWLNSNQVSIRLNLTPNDLTAPEEID